MKCLVSLGVGKIIIFSRFALTNKVEERLRELKRYIIFFFFLSTSLFLLLNQIMLVLQMG